jgi:hypothetical protein
MSVHWQFLSGARLLLAAMLTVPAAARPTARAQNVTGSLTVSATILPPVTREMTRLIAFDVARDGLAHVETTAPVAGPVSQIVMWSVSSSADGFVAVEQPPMLIEAAQRSAAPAHPWSPQPARLRFVTDVGRTSSTSADASPRSVIVRIHYLVVPGT